jgi:hypothetical protein
MSDSQPFPPPSWSPTPPPPPSSRTGPPWEADGQSVQSFVATVQGVLLDPMRLFSQMRREGGLQAPLIYAVIGIVIGALASSVYHVALSGLGMGFMGRWGGVAGASSFLTSLILVPIVMVVASFVAAGMYHLMLMLLSAARQPFETTYRVVAYSLGSTSLLNVIPFCGGIASGIWCLVAAIIGLAQAQEIPIAKAAIAVLVPGLVCCVLVAALGMLFGLSALALFGAAQGMR